MDFARGCPGSDRSSWTPEDIYEVACERCGAAVEFFKDDARRRCPSCGAVSTNPKREAACTDWCTAAENCSLGREILGSGTGGDAAGVADAGRGADASGSADEDGGRGA